MAAKVFRHFLMTKEMNSQEPQMSVLLLLAINPDGTTEFQQQKSWRGALKGHYGKTGPTYTSLHSSPFIQIMSLPFVWY